MDNSPRATNITATLYYTNVAFPWQDMAVKNKTAAAELTSDLNYVPKNNQHNGRPVAGNDSQSFLG
jgi:hypothetical protein